MGKMADLVLRGGRVIDPASGRDERTDIAFGEGKVAAIGHDLPGGEVCRCPRAPRRTRADRPARACLLGRDIARRRCRRSGATQRNDDFRRRRQRRSRQFPRLSPSCHRPVAAAHNSLPQRLVSRDLRLQRQRDGRRMRRSAAPRPARMRPGHQGQPRSDRRRQSAGRAQRRRRLGIGTARHRTRIGRRDRAPGDGASRQSAPEPA